MLTATRRDLARQILADENGVRYAAMLASGGNTSGPAAQATVATVRTELEALQRKRVATPVYSTQK